MPARPVFFALVFLAGGLTACSNKAAREPAEAKQVMEDFTMTQTKGGKTEWQLRAPQASLSMDGAAGLREPEILFHKDGTHTSTAHARKATVRGGAHDVSLEGEVVITSIQERTTLRTERLDYSAAKGRFTTEAEVQVERPGAVLRGRGLEADSALENITIFHQETKLR